MRTPIALVLNLFIANILAAQLNFESYGAMMSGDTLKIWDININSSCQSKYIASASTQNDSIIVTEEDTSTTHDLCDCFYDVNVSLTGLLSGNYQTFIYRQQLRKYQYPKDTLILVASFNTSIAGSTQTASTKISTSSCHSVPTSVRRDLTPSNYALLTSHPNPFNPTTTIDYLIPRSAHVTLGIFDEIGHAVITLIDKDENAGKHSVLFDASRFTSGVYICRLKTDGIDLTNKLVLLK